MLVIGSVLSTLNTLIFIGNVVLGWRAAMYTTRKYSLESVRPRRRLVLSATPHPAPPLQPHTHPHTHPSPRRAADTAHDLRCTQLANLPDEDDPNAPEALESAAAASKRPQAFETHVSRRDRGYSAERDRTEKAANPNARLSPMWGKRCSTTCGAVCPRGDLEV